MLQIPFLPHYYISSCGVPRREKHVITLKNKRTRMLKARRIKPYEDTYGYMIVKIKGTFYKIHRLVYFAYNPHAERDMLIHHIDGNKKNNHIKNLLAVRKKSHNTLHKNSKRTRLSNEQKFELLAIYLKDKKKHRKLLMEKFSVSYKTIQRITNKNVEC